MVLFSLIVLFLFIKVIYLNISVCYLYLFGIFKFKVVDAILKSSNNLCSVCVSRMCVLALYPAICKSIPLCFWSPVSALNMVYPALTHATSKDILRCRLPVSFSVPQLLRVK